ncbi:MAG: permease [Armatimonadota bacterium]
MDVFTCCLFTWKVLVTVVPAFLLAGAVSAFVPPQLVLRYLGSTARRRVSYSVAAISGIILSLCSCNVVPLFVSIYRTGAGIGPASTFLYAGPAINLVSLVLVFEAIGWQMGLWRAILVPVVGVLCGLTMAALFGHEDQKAHEAAALHAGPPPDTARLGGLFALLTAMVIFGAWETSVAWKVAGMGVMAVATAALVALRFSGDDLRDWGRETWYLVKTVIPVLVPAVVVIGLAAAWVDMKWIYRHVGDNSLRSVVFADLFGELMYFPILAEVVFAGAMTKLGMASGPAMAILLTGTGASLPGAIIIARFIGWRKATAFVTCELVFTIAAAMLFTLVPGVSVPPV